MSTSRFVTIINTMVNSAKQIANKPFHQYNVYAKKYETTTVGKAVVGYTIPFSAFTAYMFYAEKQRTTKDKMPVATTQPTYKSPRIG